MVPKIKLIYFDVKSNESEYVDPEYFSGQNVSYSAAGNLMANIARRSPILNQPMRINVEVNDQSAASKLSYEAKKAGIEVVGITQKAGRIVLELGAVASAILTMLVVWNTLVVGVNANGVNEAKTLKPVFASLRKAWPKIKWLAALGAAGTGIYKVAKYVNGRVNHYKSKSNHSDPGIKRGYHNPFAKPQSDDPYKANYVKPVGQFPF